MQERWLPISGYENLYQVSDQGRVRSLTRSVDRRGCGTCQYVGRSLQPSFVKGYPRVVLKDKGRNRGREVHKLVVEAFVGPCPVGQEVRHLDGIRSNAKLANLVYGTRIENQADRRRHGTDNAGERQGAHKLTTASVLAIRALRGCVPQAALAERFGVSHTAISDVQTRRRWSHLGG